MATYLPVPGTIPAGFCPASWQAVLNQFAALLPIIINGEDEVIIQVDTPGVDDRGKLWIKMLDVAPWVDSIRVWVPEIPPSGDWRPIPGQPVYFVDNGGVNTMTITTGESMNSELFLTGRLFCIKANNTNTGAVTLAVDTIAAKAVKKQNNVDLEAGDFVAGQILLLAFDPVSNVFEVVNTLTPEPTPAPVYVDTTGLVKLAPNPLVQTANDGSGTNYYTYVNHGFPGRPSYWKWVQIYNGPASFAYDPGDMQDIDMGRDADGVGNISWATDTQIRACKIVRITVGPGAYRYDRLPITADSASWDLSAVAYYVPDKAPSVTTQPSNVSQAAGTNASFTVVSSGDTPLSYQWQRNGVNIFDGGRLSGTATATLTITGIADGPPPGGDEANYSCVITNSVGTTTSNTASLTVT